MQIKRIDRDATKMMEELGVDKAGITIMAKKAKVLSFHLTGIPCGAANILKQDALSVGADVALPYGTITCSNTKNEAVLVGTVRQLEKLAQKEAAQPYGLKQMAKELKTFLHPKRYPLQIMGVVNANEDSFFSGSRFQEAEAVAHIERMIEQGAHIIDLGGVSSRPGSESVDAETELARVAPVIDLIYANGLYDKATFSLDSFQPEVLRYALDRGFSLINDITGLANPELADLAREYDARLCIMHMQNDPKTMQQSPEYEDVVLDVDRFFTRRLAAAKERGVKEESVILDVGIGFGKTLGHNLTLLNSMEHFKHHGCELLVGASRKSMIDKVIPTSVQERLPGTLAIHLKAYDNGASIIRAHDVAEHVQAFALHRAIEEV